MPPFRFAQRVRFADVDHAGIVYYPHFFHYFHTAFEELFHARIGAAGYLALLDRERIGLPAVHVECDFRRPLRFPDSFVVEVSLGKLGTRSLTLRYRAFAEGAEADGPVAEAAVTCAVIDLDSFQAVALPPSLRAMFAELV